MKIIIFLALAGFAHADESPARKAPAEDSQVSHASFGATQIVLGLANLGIAGWYVFEALKCPHQVRFPPSRSTNFDDIELTALDDYLADPSPAVSPRGMSRLMRNVLIARRVATVMIFAFDALSFEFTNSLLNSLSELSQSRGTKNALTGLSYVASATSKAIIATAIGVLFTDLVTTSRVGRATNYIAVPVGAVLSSALAFFYSYAFFDLARSVPDSEAT